MTGVRSAAPRTPAPAANEATAAQPQRSAPLQWEGNEGRPGIMQMKKKKPRSHQRVADGLMTKAGSSPKTTSTATAIGHAFLGKALRGAMGASGSLRHKLMDQVYGRAADRMEGEENANRPSFGSVIGDHLKQSMTKRFQTSDLGQVLSVAGQASDDARKRREIESRKAAGAGKREQRAASRATQPETPSPSDLFGRDEQDHPEPAAGEPPTPTVQPPPSEPPVSIERSQPVSPTSVSMSGAMTATAPSDHEDKKEHEDAEEA